MNPTNELTDVLASYWNGDIKPWKAFWLVNLLGSFIVVITTIFIAYILRNTIPIFFYGAPVTIYTVFSAVTLWRCSSKLTDSFKAILIKTYVIIYAIYMFPIILRLFGAVTK